MLKYTQIHFLSCPSLGKEGSSFDRTMVYIDCIIHIVHL